MSLTLVQRINETMPVLSEANIEAFPFQDYLTIHFTHRSEEREAGILAREPRIMECGDGGKGTDARIIRIITDDGSPMPPVFTVVPGHLHIQYAIAKRSRPGESEYTPGLHTGDANSDMLHCIYGAEGFFDPEEDVENMDMLEGTHLEHEPEDEDKQGHNLQFRIETQIERMKRIASVCDEEREEKKKKLKLEVQV